MKGTDLRKGSEYAARLRYGGTVVGVYTGEKSGSHQSTRYVIRDQFGIKHEVHGRHIEKCLDGLSASDRWQYDDQNKRRIQAEKDRGERRREHERQARRSELCGRIIRDLLDGERRHYEDAIRFGMHDVSMSIENLARMMCDFAGVPFDAQLAFAALS